MRKYSKPKRKQISNSLSSQKQHLVLNKSDPLHSNPRVEQLYDQKEKAEISGI